MAFETTMTVPTRHIPELMTRLAKAGFMVLDTGDRMTTDEGIEAEATLRLVHVSVADVGDHVVCDLGVAP